MMTQKIRSHHENLTRENENLTRQLYQRERQPSTGKRVYVVEKDQSILEVKLSEKKFLFILLVFVFFISQIHQIIVVLFVHIQMNLMMTCLCFIINFFPKILNNFLYID